ncbi:hypothetical protein XELAEV_18028404mg [Xenopus laevis]|uniref:Uncharacterized protein n=1 Tax=Xenopus laevis TaxID=8355 RepID=A0A974CZC7_XENLA|nr:hypothetical protein XELAEV_18028404mg [Xenopus laevis]
MKAFFMSSFEPTNLTESQNAIFSAFSAGIFLKSMKNYWHQRNPHPILVPSPTQPNIGDQPCHGRLYFNFISSSLSTQSLYYCNQFSCTRRSLRDQCIRKWKLSVIILPFPGINGIVKLTVPCPCSWIGEDDGRCKQMYFFFYQKPFFSPQPILFYSVTQSFL